MDGGYIRESGKVRRDKLYARGPRWTLLESQISNEIREKMRNLRSVRIDSPPIATPDRSGSSDGRSRPVEVGWGVHLPGDQLRFGVDREGSIDRTGVRVVDAETGESIDVSGGNS